MAQQYLLHLPDGTQYGPVDRATLEAWSVEGRLPEETLVWPEGAPEWVSLLQVLSARASASPAPAGAAPAATPAAAAPAATTPAPAASAPRIPAARPAPAPAAGSAPAPTAPRPPSPSGSLAVVPRAAPAAAGVDDALTRPAPRPPFSRPRPEAGPPPAKPGSGRRLLLLAAGGVLLVVVLVGGLLALLRPYLASRRAIAEVQRYALADRRLVDATSGLTLELPASWLALRGENPYVVRPGARIALAEPTVGVFGAISTAVRPAMIDDLDAHLSELLQQRLGRVPSQKEGARSDVQLGRGQGRMVRTTFEEDLVPMQGATVAWADGYTLFSLEAWAPAAAGDRFASALEALCRGLQPSGAAEARIQDAVERLTPDVPELSKDALRLLVAERLSQNRGVEDVPAAALRALSRGLEALGPQEADEMRAIFQQIWQPVPEDQRERFAGLLNEVKAGRALAPADGQALEEAVRTGVNALPEDSRARLQELSGRAVRKSLLLP